MARFINVFRLTSERNARRIPPSRRSRFTVESLEGRQLMASNFTSALGVGGSIATVQKVALDNQGNSYVAGSFLGKVSFDPGSTGGNVLDSGNTLNAFVAKYSPTNTLIWVKQFADDEAVPGGFSAGLGLAVDQISGSVYVVGQFAGKVDFDPGGNTLNLTSAGGNDAYIVKLTTNGDLDSGLAKRFGGTNTDVAFNVALDRTGTNVYLSGSFIGTANFDPGGTNTTLTAPVANQSDSFALKLSSNLGFGFAARAGLANSSGNDIAADSQGGVYLVGSQAAGTGNAYVAKFTSIGTLATEKLYGGTISGGTFALGTTVAVDSADNVYIGGTFAGTGVNFNKFNGPGTVALDSAGNSDTYLIKLDPAMSLVFARRFGSNKGDFGNDLGIDGSNNVYLTGFESGQSTFGTTGAGMTVLDTGNGLTGTINTFVLEVDSTGNFVQAIGPTGSGQSDAFGIAVDSTGKAAIAGFYTPSVTFGTTTLGALGAQQYFVARMGANTPPVTTTPPGPGTGTTPTPTFLSEIRILAGKGRKQKVVGFQLSFSGPLDLASVQDLKHYTVTQPGKRGRITNIPVLAASFNGGNNSIMLTLGKFKLNKPLQLTATGLLGVGGAMVSTVVTTL